MERREKDRKETDWEKELQLAMTLSDPLGLNNRDDSQPLQTSRSCPKLSDKAENVDTKFKKIKSCDSSFGDKCASTSTETCERKCDIEEKLQNIEFIDRTPSPVDRRSKDT